MPEQDYAMFVINLARAFGEDAYGEFDYCLGRYEEANKNIDRVKEHLEYTFNRAFYKSVLRGYQIEKDYFIQRLKKYVL